MKKYTTSQRLKQIMALKNIKQIDILNKVQPLCKQWGIKMGSNDLSQYVTGKVEPSQKKLSVLAEALNTNEVWLMGYDVPMEAEESYGNEFLSDDMASKYINLTQLSIITKIDIAKLKKIITGENKIPNPSDLEKIANALDSELYDYFIMYGYAEDPEDDNKLYETGIRYLLQPEEKIYLCECLANIWNKNTNNNYFTKENVYKTIFNSEKETFSINEVRNIIMHTTNIKNTFKN